MIPRYIASPDTDHPSHYVVLDTHTRTVVVFLGSLGSFEHQEDAEDLAERLSRGYERGIAP